MTKIVAIPDVHGCYTLLTKTIEKYSGSGAELIFLGDLIDRSPERFGDRKTIMLVRRLQRKPQDYGLSKVTVLRGNHEQALINAFKREDFRIWKENGGHPGFLDYCLTNPAVIKWFKTLPFYAIRGKYLFCHAGVKPNVPIKEQSPNDLMWIREDFLDHPHNLPYVVVHGHSVQMVDEPVVKEDRISCDLGACFGGNFGVVELTA